MLTSHPPLTKQTPTDIECFVQPSESHTMSQVRCLERSFNDPVKDDRGHDFPVIDRSEISL